MNYALFEESGRFHAGRILSEAETSLQVELDSGKRVKVKTAQVMLRFVQTNPAQLFAQAQALAQDIDLDLAWEFAPKTDFSFTELASEYFQNNPSIAEQTAALFKLFEAPHYFRRLGKGQFKKASQETVKAALLAIERKQQTLAQIQAWANDLLAGNCPSPITDQLYKILFKPDKNGPEYKAVVEASRRSQQSPLDLLRNAGAITSAYEFHWRRFLFEQFPKGTQFPKLENPTLTEDLPLAAVQAFSIDDSSTTEIDDAISVQGLSTGTIELGIHIAAPALAITPDSSLNQLAGTRLSTVYMPGHKITMLPPDIVENFTLSEGRANPAVSLYITLNEQTLEIQAQRTQLERVPVRANLRLDHLEELVTPESLQTPHTPDSAPYPFHPELAFCFRLAQHLKAQREVIRGKPETFNRPDYQFKLDKPYDQDPTGEEPVVIQERRRGAPLDLLVAELMILANSTWGNWLAELGVPAIYRSQASMAPGVKVRMGTKPAPHAGMGVQNYAWSSSPLRRYIDLVNQWQIIACARHGRMAALAAPFKPKDVQLYATVSKFEDAHSAYGEFQRNMERFWTLRWLEQNHLPDINASVLKDGLVRAETLPLVFKVAGTEHLERGTRIRTKLHKIDLISLEIHTSFIEKIEEPVHMAGASNIDEEEEEITTTSATGLQLAISLEDDSPDAQPA